MAINIYGQLACASGDRLTNAEEIRDDAMQETLGTKLSPTQAEINQYLKTAVGNAASSADDGIRYCGTVDVTSNETLATIKAAVPDDGDCALFVCADASGAVSGGYAVCDSTLAAALHANDSRGVAVNLGDLLIARNDGGTVTVKTIPLAEAKKPADAGNVGTYGLMVPNDKEKLYQAVTDIDQTCFRCYSGEYNMNYCGWYGYYMYGTLGRPAGSSDGEFYVLRVANGGTDGDYVVLEQTAYSCADPARVFRRIVKTKDRSDMGADGNTTWGDWTQLPTAADLAAVSQKVSDMLDGAPEAYDTLKEIADYLSTHQDEYAALVELVNKKDVTMCVATTSEVETGEETDNTSTRLFLHQGGETKTPVIQIKGSGFTSVSAAGPTADRMQVVTIATDISEATTEESGLMSASDKEKLDATPSLTVLTQDEYDALETKDEDTVYLIKG